MLSNIVTLAALSTLTSAFPAMEPAIVKYTAPAFGDVFGISGTGKGITNVPVRAVGGALYLGGEQDGVECEDGAIADFASFVWYSDKSLFLYTNSNPVQQVKVDPSGMGQGVTFYDTGNQKTSSSASEGPWEINNSTRTVEFGTTGAKACPTGEKVDQAGIDQRYRLWFTELENPASNKDCVDVELLAYTTDARPVCKYSPSA